MPIHRLLLLAAILAGSASLNAVEPTLKPMTIPLQVGFGRILIWPGGSPGWHFHSTSSGVEIAKSEWDAAKKRWVLRLECHEKLAGFLQAMDDKREVAKAALVPFSLDLPDGGVINAKTNEGGHALTFHPNVPGIVVRMKSNIDGLAFKNGGRESSFTTDAQHADGVYTYIMIFSNGNSSFNYTLSLWDGEQEIDDWQLGQGKELK